MLGIFSYKKCHFRYALEGLGMIAVYFMAPLEYQLGIFLPIWYFCCHFDIFSPFWFVVPGQIWQPWSFEGKREEGL
jgi:hypothetical protein